MPCDPDELRHVPLFELLDDDEARVLAAQVEIRRFQPRERIFKVGDPPEHGYVVMSGKVCVVTMDEDQQEVVVDEPTHGIFFGFASMLQQTPHQTTATALEETVCLEVGRDDIAELVKRRPDAGLDDLRTEKTIRYYSARHWRPWMLQWGFMPPHPSVYIRKKCFERLGAYALDYKIAALAVVGKHLGHGILWTA